MGTRAWVVAVLLVAGACGKPHVGNGGDGGVDSNTADACTSLQCQQVDCASKGLPPTTITGTVYAPNGTLPLYGVNVYVPFSDPGELSNELKCDRCTDEVPGGAITLKTTDEAGAFTLPDVPATTNVPVVIQVGKWRRQLVIPAVAACQETKIDIVDTTLPKSVTDASPLTALDATTHAPKVDLPRIAISTGAADALECLMLKLGIAPSEITNDVGPGHVHLYTNNHAPGGQGAKQFQAGWPGGDGATFGDAETMWSDLPHLSAYDIVMFSCEGGQFPLTKPQSALEAVQQYADLGGRVFMTHWHNIWIGGEDGAQATHGIPTWETVATFNYAAPQDLEHAVASVDLTQNAKGASFSTWLTNVGASTTPGQVPIDGARYTCSTNDPANGGTSFLDVDPALPINSNHQSVQDLQFTTPVGATADQACGKVVFSDMHVASGSSSKATVPYPGPGAGSGCAQTDLSPQEKALAFIFFDISSCVGSIQ